MQLDPDVPIIHADPDQLQEVFINLLKNAAESMDHGGTITLYTKLDAQIRMEKNLRYRHRYT